MAIFHFSVQVISRASGRSAVSAAAYRAGERLHDERLDRDHDFRARSGVEHSDIMLPQNAPEEWRDRERLWNDVEAFERRKDAQLAREVEFSIPREMSKAQGIELARDFVQTEFVDRGMVADLNVHWDIGADGQPKPHAHVMLTMREVVGREDGTIVFGAKVREWNDHENVERWRGRWETHVNTRLAELDIDARIDRRSLADQGIDLEPQSKIGGPAHRMDAKGLEADRAELHREIARENGGRIIADPGIALNAITHQQATFTNRDMAMFIHRHSDGQEQFNEAMRAVRGSLDLIALGKDGRGEDRFTSREMIETEQRMSRAADQLAAHRDDGLPAATIYAIRAAESRGLTLGAEQEIALRHITSGRGLSLVLGYAGTGKSAMLGVARETWEGSGFNVRGVALAGIAAEGLENGSGIASRTIASMEHGWSQGHDLLTARDVLVVDEAGMVGTRQMERVLSHAADAGAKVVLVGDPQQLQSIEAGAAFRALHGHHGGVEITQVRRQHEGWQRDATRHLATGRTGEAIAAYADKAMVHRAETREEARRDLVERWDRDREANPDASRIILTHTNAEVRDLNDAARNRMRDAGQLGDDVLVKVERGDRQFASGDRIMFLRNERSLDVKNGTLGTIEKVREGRMAVRTDDGRSVSFETKQYRDLDHGYAATIHKAQGMTVDRAHVLATPGMDRHGAYVALSRHRDDMALHYGRDDFKDDARLARILSRERAKDMATDYAKADPARAPSTALRRAFAERRGISFRERVAEIFRPVVEKARGIFDGLDLGSARRDEQAEQRDRASPSLGMFDGFRPNAERPEQERAIERHQHEPQPFRAGGVRGAVERYAKALDAVQQTRAQGLDAVPRQREALDRAKEALDAIRPEGATDLDGAFRANPELVREAAEGRGQAAVRAMQLETEIRMDPFQRADRFVEGWQQLQRHHEDLVRDGNFRGAKIAAQQMADMAKSLERDAQLESVLGLRSRELGLEIDQQMGRSLSHDLASSIPFDHGQDDMDGEQSLLNEPAPEPRPNAAAEAFAELSERVAGMEERLDGRMAVMSRALEHIAVEKQSIEVPDYSPTLAKMGGMLATLAGQTKTIMDAPAMQLTPESMAERIVGAARAARETDRATIKQAQELHRLTHTDQMRAIGAVRTKREQRLQMLYTGIGTALAVTCVWLIYPGWAASIGPQSWLWPERVARRVLGEPTPWDAGIRLMRAGNPEGWQAILDAADMRRENRDTINACERTAVKAKETVRCTIRIGRPSS